MTGEPCIYEKEQAYFLPNPKDELQVILDLSSGEKVVRSTGQHF